MNVLITKGNPFDLMASCIKIKERIDFPDGIMDAPTLLFHMLGPKSGRDWSDLPRILDIDARVTRRDMFPVVHPERLTRQIIRRLPVGSTVHLIQTSLTDFDVPFRESAKGNPKTEAIAIDFENQAQAALVDLILLEESTAAASSIEAKVTGSAQKADLKKQNKKTTSDQQATRAKPDGVYPVNEVISVAHLSIEEWIKTIPRCSKFIGPVGPCLLWALYNGLECVVIGTQKSFDIPTKWKERVRNG